ncbi:Retrovirus-related Pol polyprotein from transposon RE1 [Vitis vinifera]|uniref:Retrovirus-related Pol polyprotein from transposon RE1 n=1 Tax=Vitis vinifera TaxID=29760 RepID=A0A438IP37_VITVI|nr:Retrovirus-related Pol polyprotein from transposon RE1 [Vitis vinifera]
MESRTEESNSEVTSRPEAVHSSSASTTNDIILPITGHKLNGQNFIQWAQSVRIFICGKGKEEYLTGAIVQPKEDDPRYRTWKLENSMVMSWLINSMTNDIGENFMYYGTTKEIWDAVRETYSNIDNTSAIFEIKSILQDLRQGDSTVTEYFNILTRYWQQLDIYEELVWKCPEDGLLYKKVIEKDRIYKFLLGLNKNLDEQNREGRGYTAAAEEDTFGTSSNPRPFSKEQLEALQKMFQQTLQSTGTTIGTASVAQKGIFSHALNVRQENHTTWIVDSGASDHMTGNLMVFHEYTPCHNNSSIRIADGTLSRALNSGKRIGNAEVHAGLYLLRAEEIRRLPMKTACVVSNPSTKTDNVVMLWHYQLGSRWFVTFVDDHTRVTWVFLMKKKSEVKEIFENFNNMVQTQFQAKIQVLRTDNAREYYHNILGSYLLENGIVHQSSCIDTPQKNGVAERKNRHLMEVARSLMIASNVPKQLWGEAVLTETYLINRMPSRILQFKTPCQILLAAYPSAQIISSIPIKVFGCTAFVHIHKSQRSKLDPTATKCIFLGTTSPLSSSLPPQTDTTLSVPENNSLDVPSVTPESTTQGSKEEEIQALEKNGTWEISELPKGKRPVGCKWIFTVKHNPDGSINRFKARLVAKGFTQSYDIDYEETFAPVAKLNSIKVLLSVAVNLDWNLHQLDVKNAFLNGELEEEVYMKIPPSMETPENSGKVCKLRKSLYGLKQSPRAWFDRLTRVVKKHGFIQCQADYTLFMKHSKKGEMTLFIVYVDDIIITGDDEEGIGNLKKLLAREFEIKDLGQLRYFLGMEVGRTKEGIVVTQRKYVLDLLQETGMLGCKPVDTPMDPIGKIDKDNDSHPTDKDRILQYLKKSPGRGLYFKKTSSREVEVFTDADWAGSLTDWRSTTGYCSYVWGNLVTWRSKKQSVVARSSAEAEFRAMANGICEGMWLQRILKELGIISNSTMTVLCDNKATISIAKNPVQHDRTKHVEIDRHFIKEKLEGGTIRLMYIPSSRQTADILTKALPKATYENMKSKLGMLDIYYPT